MYVQLANVTKQVGSNDCALFAAAYCTSIAYGVHPSSQIYNQQHMREHLYNCLTNQNMLLFPASRKRRVAVGRCGNKSISEVPVFCYCRCPDDGQKMVCCDRCEEWYHMTCIGTNLKKGVPWFCEKCK